jgi:hypothetical protein
VRQLYELYRLEDPIAVYYLLNYAFFSLAVWPPPDLVRANIPKVLKLAAQIADRLEYN